MDYSPLHRTVTIKEVDQYRRSLGNTSKLFYYPSRRTLIILLLAIIFGIVGIVMMPDRSGGSTFFKTATAALVIGTGLTLLAVLVTRGQYKSQLLLAGFCQKNALIYKNSIKDPSYTGMIFSNGNDREIKESIGSEGLHPFEIGNYKYETGSGKYKQIHDWGYVRIQLNRQVPNMVLDASRNNVRALGLNMTNLPAVFKKDQVLSLEGDFDKYFTLYAPKEYERDALYVFTPDLMALLIDGAAQFDVEIVDNYMYIYSPVEFDFFVESTLERLFTIISTVGAKMESRTDRYSDERVANRVSDVVATEGKRLRRGTPWTIITIAIIIIILQVIASSSSFL